jgi:hypothetical protein
MDATSSAYQIMSFFLNNEDLARSTNVFNGNGDDFIRDLYSGMLHEFTTCIERYLDKDLAAVVSGRLTRGLMKKREYMPLVYGKTRHRARKVRLINRFHNGPIA